MIVGLAKEVKNNEGRVALLPADAGELVALGHTVYFEKGCGVLSGIEDAEYCEYGAIQLDTHEALFEKSDLIIKVKEIVESEYSLLKDGQTIIGFFHLTADKKQTDLFLEKNITSIDYEYFKNPKTGKRAITMSPIAGRLGMMQGFNYLCSSNGGKGVLPMGVPGVEPANVTIVGAGDAGLGAIKVAVNMGANVTVLLRDVRKLEALENDFGNQITYKILNRENVIYALKTTDAFVNCMYWDKLRTDHLVYRKDLSYMKKGAIIVDISCDIAGGVETCRATTHDDPVYEVDGITHYCVDNIPGAVAYTSSKYICAQSFPFIKEIVEKGTAAFASNEITRGAVLTHNGEITHSLIGNKWEIPVKQILDLI